MDDGTVNVEHLEHQLADAMELREVIREEMESDASLLLELRQVDEKIRKLNVAIFAARKRITKVAGVNTRCPVCERRMALGAIFQGAK